MGATVVMNQIYTTSIETLALAREQDLAVLAFQWNGGAHGDANSSLPLHTIFTSFSENIDTVRPGA
jgi:hypothetical protein